MLSWRSSLKFRHLSVLLPQQNLAPVSPPVHKTSNSTPLHGLVLPRKRLSVHLLRSAASLGPKLGLQTEPT